MQETAGIAQSLENLFSELVFLIPTTLNSQGDVRPMKISARVHGAFELGIDNIALLTGRLPKLAVKQVDDVEDLSFKGIKDHHRVSFRYDKELGRSIAQIIDNSTGETVKELPTPTQVAHLCRMKKLMGLFVDERA